MILAVLDTNILASGTRKLHDPDSTPGKILTRWIEGEFILVASAPIRSELRRTFLKPYFRQHLTDEQVDDMLQLLATESALVELSVAVQGIASEPADDRILATALSAGADYLMTGDRALLDLREHEGVQIISAREFLTILELLGRLRGGS